MPLVLWHIRVDICPTVNHQEFDLWLHEEGFYRRGVTRCDTWGEGWSPSICNTANGLRLLHCVGQSTTVATGSVGVPPQTLMGFWQIQQVQELAGASTGAMPLLPDSSATSSQHTSQRVASSTCQALANGIAATTICSCVEPSNSTHSQRSSGSQMMWAATVEWATVVPCQLRSSGACLPSATAATVVSNLAQSHVGQG